MSYLHEQARKKEKAGKATTHLGVLDHWAHKATSGPPSPSVTLYLSHHYHLFSYLFLALALHKYNDIYIYISSKFSIYTSFYLFLNSLQRQGQGVTNKQRLRPEWHVIILITMACGLCHFI